MIYSYRITAGLLEEKLYTGYVEAKEEQEALSKLFDILQLNSSPNSITITKMGDHISISN